MRRTFLNHKQLATGVAAVLGLAAAGCRDNKDTAGEGALVPPVGVTVPGTEPGGDLATPGGGVPGSPDGLPGAGGAVEVPLDIPTQLYEIQKGDTLSGIAGAHGTSVSTLQKLNGITGSFIRYGQKIKVPVTDAAEAPAPAVPDPTPVPAVPDAPSGVGAELSTQPPAVAVPPVAPKLPDEEAPRPVPPPAPGAGAGAGAGGAGLGFGGESAPRGAEDGFLTLPPAE